MGLMVEEDSELCVQIDADLEDTNHGEITRVNTRTVIQSC